MSEEAIRARQSGRRVDWFLLGLVVATALAWLLPEPGARGGVLHAELLNKLGVALIFFLHGLTLSFAALRAGVLLWRLHLLVQLATFLVCPLFGLLGWWLWGAHFSPALRVGLFYLCALPSTVSSSVAMTAAAGGNVPAAVFNATLSSLLGVVLTPLWLSFVLGAQGGSLPLGHVILDLVTWLILPLTVGQLLRPLFGVWASRHKSRLGVIDRATILLLVYTSFCDSVLSGVWRGNGAGTLSFTFLFSCALLMLMMIGVGAASKALDFAYPERAAAIFCGSKKSLASGVPMARLIFGAHPGIALILLPIMIYHPLQLVVCGWIAGRWARRSRTIDVQREPDLSDMV